MLLAVLHVAMYAFFYAFSKKLDCASKSINSCIGYSIAIQKGSDAMQEIGKSVLELTNRELLKMSGVQNVEVFEEEKIALHTEQGNVEIQGSQLTIIQLDLESGILQIQGSIDGIIYPQERRRRQNKNHPKQSFFNKMLS